LSALEAETESALPKTKRASPFSDRQQPDAVPERINGNERTGFEICFSGSNRAENGLADGRRENVLGPDLNDAGPVCPVGGKQHPEIQIVRENDPAVGRGKIEDLGIRRPR